MRKQTLAVVRSPSRPPARASLRALETRASRRGRFPLPLPRRLARRSRVARASLTMHASRCAESVLDGTGKRETMTRVSPVGDRVSSRVSVGNRARPRPSRGRRATRASTSADARETGERATGTVTRVARMGKTLTFVDVHAREAMCDARGNATTTVFCKIISETVPKTVRKGAVVSFEWEMETRNGNGVGTRTGAYVEARDVRVERAAPVANVANATGEMLARYGKRSSRGLIDVTKSERGRTSMSAFGVCKNVLAGEACADPNCTKRHDVTEEELRLARESRARARERSRRAKAAERSEDDPHGEANKEAKCVSDRLFAQWCVETFNLKEKSADGREHKVVADIVGGSGTLSFEFHVNHGVGCVLVEPRCVSLTPRQRATWSNLRRRGARTGAKTEARDAWLRSEMWIACADEQKERRMQQHMQRLIAYTEVATEEDLDDVVARAPPSSDDTTVLTADFEEFPSETPRTVATSSRAKDIAPFTHVRSEFWSLQNSAVGDRIRELNPSLLVGMHPDQATEAIVDAALELNMPFAVVPCCTFPELFPHRRSADGEPVASYTDFIRYLADKHPSIQKTFLPFKGRNQVLFRTVD